MISPRSLAVWAPAAKLRAPLTAADVVLAEGLAARTREMVMSRRLTLIVAAPGSGKTTLAAAVAEQISSVAWVRLDEHDNEPGALLELIAASCERLVGGDRLIVGPLFERGIGSQADARRAAAVLLNDLERAGPEPLVIVLDDLHALSGDACDLLAYVIDHLPQGVRVLATSRVEPQLPLARMRVLQDLGEVRGDDLALDAAHAMQLLNDRLKLDLSFGQVEALVTASSGWVTGIRLLGRSPESLDDYLDQELIGRESPEVAQFLTDLAVLDAITPLSAAAVTGRDDAGALLADLVRRHSLFVQVLNRDRPEYRLHDLLRSHLLRRLRMLGPARLGLLHRRAARVTPTLAGQVEHLLAANAWDEAVVAIETSVHLFARPAELQRAAGWIERLPEALRGRSRLAVIEGVVAAQRGDVRHAVGRLEPLLPRLGDAGDETAAWLAVRTLHIATYDHARYVPRLHEIEQGPVFAALPPSARADHHMSFAYGALFAGDWDEVGQRVDAGIDIAVSTSDAGAAEALAQHLSPMLAGAPGVVERVAAYADWAAARLPGHPLVEAGVVHQRAWTLLLRGDPGGAAAIVRRSPRVAALIQTFPYLRATVDWVLATAAITTNDLVAAETGLRAGTESANATDLDVSLDGLRRVLLARVLRQRGDLAGVVRVEQRLNLAGGQEPTLEHSGIVREAVAAQRLWCEGNLEDAERAFRGLLSIERTERVRVMIVNPRVDLALVLAARGRVRDALTILADAVASFDEWGTPGLLVAAGPEILPLVKRLEPGATVAIALEALDTAALPAPIPVPGSTDVLTGREVQVLRLLDGGASNQAIADRLVLSTNTVKTHVRNLMAKLGARSRGELVATARRNHLL